MAQNTAEAIEDSMVPMPAEIPAGLVKMTPEALLIEGGVATGKTQTLLERAIGLLDTGVSVDKVLVVCATPGAAEAFKTRLVQARPGAAGIEITTARQWSLRALREPEAQRVSGFGARMLAPFEIDILMEDLKTSGVRPRRLKEMLRFFYKSLTELCDWEEDWLLTGEEQLVYGLLQDCLRFTGGILEPQVCNAACKWLFNGEGAGSFGYDHVLVDDYQLMSRASQVLVNRLARLSIAVTADPSVRAEVFDSYPYEQGLQEFLDANPHVQITRLTSSFACPAAVGAANGIASHPLVQEKAVLGNNQVGAHDVRRIWAETPSGELADICSAVEDGVRGGRKVSVVATNALWVRNIVRGLEDRGIKTRRGFTSREARGDLRDLTRCSVPRILTALSLLADPADGLAMRTWCGMGETFAASSAMAVVREKALKDGMPTANALQELCIPLGQAQQMRCENDHLTRAVQSARELVNEYGHLGGGELLDALAHELVGPDAHVPEIVESLTAPFDDGRLAGHDAHAMNARVRERLCAPEYLGQGDVTVTTMELGITGETPDLVVLCGMVDGFFPSKGVLDRELMVQADADKQTAKDLHRLIGVVGKPQLSLVITGFTQVGLETAERTGLKIARVQLDEAGNRVALAKPSTYLGYMG